METKNITIEDIKTLLDNENLNQEEKDTLTRALNLIKDHEGSIPAAENEDTTDTPVSLKNQASDTHDDMDNAEEDEDADSFDPISLGETRYNIDLLDCENPYDKNDILKPGFSHYAVCIRDFGHNKNDKPLSRKLLSIIRDNVNNCISDEYYKELSKNNMVLDNGNPLLLSGLFIFKIDEETASALRIYNSDIKLDIFVPVESELKKIAKVGTPAKYDIGSFSVNYPVLNGYILSYDAIRSIIEDPKISIIKGMCYDMDALYDWGHVLCRNKNKEIVVFDRYNAYYARKRYDDIINEA